MKERLVLVVVFYLSFSSFSGLISIGLWVIAGQPIGQNFWRFLPVYLLLKILTDLLIWYYLKRYNPGRLFFYSNKGISETSLFISAFVLDIGLFFAMILVVVFCQRIAQSL